MIPARWRVAVGCAAALVAVATALAPRVAVAQSADAPERAAVQSRLHDLLPGGAVARTAWTEDGALHYLGFPAGVSITPSRREAGKPEVAALSFLTDNAALFGTGDAALGFQTERTRDRGARRFVRVQQTAHGVPVFGGQMIVQLDPGDAVQAVTGNVTRGAFPIAAAGSRPALAAAAATAAARARAATRGVSPQLEVGSPVLMWYVPQLIREEGPTALVWQVEVRDPLSPTFDYRWLLDARDGSLLREFLLACPAISRKIWDANSDTVATTVARVEGGPPSSVAEANDAYDMFGDTYNFYWTRHGRDGVNGAGALHNGIVRFCTGGAEPACPWGNASASTNAIWFGLGTVKDDVVAHEWTHGVTAFESQLIYANESGSINESLSDIWGEFVDLTNTRGDDSPAVRWRLGEDLAGPVLTGALRSMKNPPAFADPDRRNSSWYYVGNDEDHEVHTNSGVNNKLCYLLTDGDTFNGHTVYGLGIDRIADLYYEAQTNLLFNSSGWASLSVALQQAAINLGWNDADQLNLYRGLLAVEIAYPGDTWVDAAAGCFFPNGTPTCDFFSGPFPTVVVGHNAARPGDILHVRAGNYFGPHTLTKPLTLRAEGGTVTIGP